MKFMMHMLEWLSCGGYIDMYTALSIVQIRRHEIIVFNKLQMLCQGKYDFAVKSNLIHSYRNNKANSSFSLTHHSPHLLSINLNFSFTHLLISSFPSSGLGMGSYWTDHGSDASGGTLPSRTWERVEEREKRAPVIARPPNDEVDRETRQSAKGSYRRRASICGLLHWKTFAMTEKKIDSKPFFAHLLNYWSTHWLTCPPILMAGLLQGSTTYWDSHSFCLHS